MNIVYPQHYGALADLLREKLCMDFTDPRPLPTLKDCALAVYDKSATGLIAEIDTSTNGSNYETYDLIHDFKKLTITREYIIHSVPEGTGSRYVLLQDKPAQPEKADTASLIFVVSHKPGSLYRALAIFENYALNLTKIESRRVYAKDYQYIFYVDFSYHRGHLDRMDEILALFRENTRSLQIAGFYSSVSE